MKKVDLDELERLAKAATVGPWRQHHLSPQCINGPAGRCIADCYEALNKDNAAYIAAANPSTVLALLEELRLARAVVAEAARYEQVTHPCSDRECEWNLPQHRDGEVNELRLVEALAAYDAHRTWGDGETAAQQREIKAAIAHARTDVPDLCAYVRELEHERDAYKKAKAENDERFMNERDQAVAERDAALKEIDSLRAKLAEVEVAASLM